VEFEELTEPFHRYWGKARPAASDGGGIPCHLLPYHSLDVAAVAYWLLDPAKPRAQFLAKALGVKPEQLRTIFAFLLAIHDLGKFSQSFQDQASPDAPILIKRDQPCKPGRHAGLGMLLWRRGDIFCEEIGRACGWPAQQKPRGQERKALELLLGTAFGHHGEPIGQVDDLVENYFAPEDEIAARAFAVNAAELIVPQWPMELMGDPGWGERLKRISWHLAGLAVLADWLGSDQSCFPYRSDPVSLKTYWLEDALPRAEKQLRRLGFDRPPQPVDFPGVSEFFGFDPTPLQRWAEEVALVDSPQLFILEDVTGAGKTEAAIALAHRLLAQGKSNGIYFGLPTMATSNAMYTRIADYYRRWFTAESQPNLVLAHGASRLNATFRESIYASQPGDLNYRADERSATAACNQWFADSRKRALLADVGVGTVDQALMGVLPFRHQALRLVGLSNKVLLVDEIHACDDYMLALLVAVLESHARQGGNAVLLTATLPLAMRRKLIEAWGRGLGQHTSSIRDEESFPLASVVSGDGLAESRLETRPSVRRDLRIKQIYGSGEALALCLETAKNGGCACWIRNTVDDAIEAFRLAREQAVDPEKVLLFHSRFVMGDRQHIEGAVLSRFGKTSRSEGRAGCILIGTQVLEQSLDFCADVMVSDLAPIDLLIQRAGRLHRHLRDAAGNPIEKADATDGRPLPVLHVLAPTFSLEPDREWIRRLLPGTAAVYRNHGQLWLTLKTLLEEQSIRMPDRARYLIESVYGVQADAEIPEALEQSFLNDEGERHSQIAMAQFNRLDLDKGYVADSAMSGWQPEVDIGTRLSDEPSVKVTLVKLNTAAERIEPYWPQGQSLWEMSQLSVRQSMAEKLPQWPPQYESLREQLLAEQPGLRYSKLVLEASLSDGYCYDSSVGLHKPRVGGEQR